MLVKELIGRVVTNIYATCGVTQGWLDTAECFVELDNILIIDIPYGFSENVWIKELDPKATSTFGNLDDIPTYLVNKENKTIGEIAEAYHKRKKTIFNKIKEMFLGKEVIPREYRPYKVEYRENPLKHIRHRKIADFLWYDEEDIKGFLVLDNGYVISETTMSPRGTGQAGLNLYESVEDLSDVKGTDYKLLSRQDDWQNS